MKIRQKSWMRCLVAFMLFLTISITSIVPVRADNGYSDADAFNALIGELMGNDSTPIQGIGQDSSHTESFGDHSGIGGKYTCVATNRTYDFSGTTYKRQGGGYYTWAELFNSSWNGGYTNIFNTNNVEGLNASAKQKFVERCLTIANAMVYDTESGNTSRTYGVSTDTVNEFMNIISEDLGMGSTLLAAVLKDTKANFSSGSKIWQPFSGPISTAIGVLAIAMMSLLGLSTALDLAYVCIPPMQLFFGGAEGGNGAGGNSNNSGVLSHFISKAAKRAVSDNSGAGGANGGGDGSAKSGASIYFKYRWKELLVIGFCLLYLVQGEIWSLISWLINLVSGFLNL